MEIKAGIIELGDRIYLYCAAQETTLDDLFRFLSLHGKEENVDISALVRKIKDDHVYAFAQSRGTDEEEEAHRINENLGECLMTPDDYDEAMFYTDPEGIVRTLQLTEEEALKLADAGSIWEKRGFTVDRRELRERVRACFRK